MKTNDKKVKDLPKHYGIYPLAEVTGESASNLQWWYEMGWLKATKRTKCYPRFTIKAYKEACRLSAEHVPVPVKNNMATKQAAVAAPKPDIFDELMKRYGNSDKQPKKGRSYATT